MARRSASGLFDLGIAGFAAAAIGFAGFAMPEWRLFQLLQLTGLPDLLAAANPPLGLKARIGTAALLAAAAFGGVLLLMRLLDRVPARREKGEWDEAAEAVDIPIRLRRADAHPDNPARRPLIAGRELGEPFDELLLDVPADPSPDPAADRPAPAGPLPAFLVPDDEPLVATAAPAEDLVDYVDVAPPMAPPAPPSFRPVAFTEADAPVAPMSAPEPILVRPIEAPADEPASPAREAAERGEESIAELMARLEGGLRRRERTSGAAGQPAPAADDRIADRLRSAMTDLQKLAVRG